MSVFSRILVLVFCVALEIDLQAGGPAPVGSALAAQTSQPIYSAAQADRGKIVYEQSCSSCHGASLRGGANDFAAPSLAGPFFLEKWGNRTLEELFRYASDNMPPDGRLSEPSDYIDLLAYVLQVLKFPAGSAALTADSSALKRPIDPKQ
jgi:cytochrome c